MLQAREWYFGCTSRRDREKTSKILIVYFLNLTVVTLILLIFALLLWHIKRNIYTWSLTQVPDKAPKSPGISWGRDASCSNEMTLGGLLDGFRMGLVTRETKPWLEAWNFQPHPPSSTAAWGAGDLLLEDTSGCFEVWRVSTGPRGRITLFPAMWDHLQERSWLVSRSRMSHFLDLMPKLSLAGSHTLWPRLPYTLPGLQGVADKSISLGRKADLPSWGQRRGPEAPRSRVMAPAFPADWRSVGPEEQAAGRRFLLMLNISTHEVW